MKKLTKALLVSASAIALASTSNAIDIKFANGDVGLKLSAYAHFQAGLRNQNRLVESERALTARRKNFAFYNETAFTAEIYREIDEATYGARIVLVPTSKRKGGATYNGSHMYIETSFGRAEMGAPILPSSKMMETANSITADSGNWGNYANLSSNHITQGREHGADFETGIHFFLGDKLGTSIDEKSFSSEPPRSVSYYTPKFEPTDTTKVQIGVGYTPDSANTGADKITITSNQCQIRNTPGYMLNGTTSVESFKIDRSVKNAVTYGFTVEQNITDGVDLKLALTGEHGKAAGALTAYDTAKASGNVVQTYKLKNLNTYNIGGILNIGTFSLAGSYGSLGKSLTNRAYHQTGQKTDYYTAGVAFKQGPFVASAKYFKSSQFRNTVDAVTLGTSFQIAPGFKTYADLTRFIAKGKPEFNSNTLSRRSTKGTVALIGAKLNI